jgi:S-formylglutathione hydrolase FrmB
MKRSPTLISVLLSLNAALLWGQGTILDDSFFSSSLGTQRNVTLYLPSGYFDSTSIYYPTVYFLHGFGGNNTSYSEMYPVLDSLIENEIICPMIVVKPDGSSVPYIGSYYTNSVLNGDYEDYIIDDLITYIDANYRTLSDERYRGISGHSMGGYGTMKLAMKHSDKFSSLTAHSGPIKFDRLPDLIPDLQNERDPGEPFEPWDGPISIMLFGMAAAFTPNLSNFPFLVDLPIDTTGNLIDSVWTNWFDHDPFTMINDHIPELETLAIYFDCGDQDELLLFPHSVEFSDTLTSLGISHTFVPYPGGHGDSLITRTDDSFIFHSNIICSSIGIEENTVFNEKRPRFTLLQNVPNPFNKLTAISYQIPQTPLPDRQTGFNKGGSRGIPVSLKVYDITGKLVKTLVDMDSPHKSHESPMNIDWDGKNDRNEELPAGIYFYQLTTSQVREINKMVLLK